MKTNRRNFMELIGVAGAGALTNRAASGGGLAAAPEALQSAGKRAVTTELFLDNNMIEVTPGVPRKLHPPEKHLSNPVVRRDRWWEGDFLQPYTTMYDEEEKLFKMWARTGSDHARNYLDGNAGYMTYLTSADGIHWDKPELGVVTFAGRRDHNVVFTSDMVAASIPNRPTKRFVIPSRPAPPQGKKAFFWSVVKHPQPKDANERFVALAIVQDHRRGAHIVTSPDGIHWSCADAPFWQTPHDVSGYGDDCLMHLIYDTARHKWVIYRRIIPEVSERMIADDSDREREPVNRYYRSYAYAESEDLREWKNYQFILSMQPDDPADTELYQFSCHKYEDIYVGYMSVFHLRPQSIDIRLATSRDGINFTRVCRDEPFIPSGPLGYYDYMAMCCSQPEPIVVEDTTYIYYSAVNVPHDFDPDLHGEEGGAGLVTFKRHRFASLETGESGSGLCRVVTKPFIVRHPKLFLNAATWEKGSIRVEALTRDWRPISGFTEPEAHDVQGNALDHPVRWKDNADVRKLLGSEIRLKFYMTRARLHAITLADQDRKLGAVGREYMYNKREDYRPKLI